MFSLIFLEEQMAASFLKVQKEQLFPEEPEVCKINT